jgi:hypothetical protein
MPVRLDPPWPAIHGDSANHQPRKAREAFSGMKRVVVEIKAADHPVNEV